MTNPFDEVARAAQSFDAVRRSIDAYIKPFLGVAADIEATRRVALGLSVEIDRMLAAQSYALNDPKFLGELNAAVRFSAEMAAQLTGTFKDVNSLLTGPAFAEMAALAATLGPGPMARLAGLTAAPWMIPTVETFIETMGRASHRSYGEFTPRCRAH